MGGAMLAMTACGAYPTVEAACKKLVREVDAVFPQPVGSNLRLLAGVVLRAEYVLHQRIPRWRPPVRSWSVPPPQWSPTQSWRLCTRRGTGSLRGSIPR